MNLKYFIHLALAVTFFFSNALAVHSAEANFWAERRGRSKRHYSQNATTGTNFSVITGSGDSSSLLLAQLPGAQPIELNGNSSTPSLSFDLPINPVSEIQPRDLTVAQTALTRDGSADWLDPLVNPYGTVREIHLSKKANSPLIIHIQDVHGYVDAQKNIAGMIEGLSKYRGVNLVGMEAAEGAFALEDLRRFPDRDIKERVTNWAIKKDLIGGAEKSGIMAEKPLTLWGVEDAALYQSNAQAVKDSLAKRSEALAFHGDLTKNVTRLKGSVYSEELKKYDDNLLAYQDQRRGLGEYLNHLAGQSSGGQKGLGKKFPNTAQLLNALDQESQLDFKQVERERVSLVERLAARLDEKTLNGLVKESMAYRAGRVTYGRYYAYVKDLCRQAKIDLTKFPGMMDYIAYVGLSEKINRYDLLDELERLEESVATQLTRTNLERGVLALSRDSVLLGKLMNNAMTPQDWGRYLARRGEMLNLEVRGKSLAQQAGVMFEARIPQDFAEFVKPFEEFCRLALARNRSLAENLFAKMGKDRVKTAVLVTGGFHTEGLLAEIDRRGASYVVLTPRVEIVKTDKNYLDAFAHDPVPLEKLFDGEKISILTARTTVAVGQAGEEVSGPQKIGLAMVMEMVRSWVAELTRENRPHHEIRETIKKRLAELLLKLGGIFQEMALQTGSVSPGGFVLKASIGGTNYRAATSYGDDGVRVSLPPTVSPDGLENAYNQFARTRFGAWLKGFSFSAFQSIAEVFFAPSLERPLTKNLFTFGQGHGFSILALSPLGWIAMMVDKSTDWKSFLRSVGGWTAIATMGMAGFSPTIAAFYFTFVDPAGMFSTAIGLMLFAVVALVNYGYRTNFYMAPHGLVNAIIIGLNMILAGLNRFIPSLTFRFARLTIGNVRFSPSRGFTEKAIADFISFLEIYANSPNRGYPQRGNSNLIDILREQAETESLKIDSEDVVQHKLIAFLGGLLIDEIKKNQLKAITVPRTPYSQLIPGSVFYSKVPEFLPTISGIEMSERMTNDTQADFPFAQVYDEWIRRIYFFAFTTEGASVFEKDLQESIWNELLMELKGESASPVDTDQDTREINYGEEIQQIYDGPFQLVLAPGKFEVALAVYSKNDLPQALRLQAAREGIPRKSFYLVRHTKYGDYIMGLNDSDGSRVIELYKGGFVTLVEARSVEENSVTVSVRGDSISIRKINSSSRVVLMTKKKTLTKKGQLIQGYIESACDFITDEKRGLESKTIDEQLTATNHIWNLRMLGERYNDEELTREGVSSGVLTRFRSIVNHPDLEELIFSVDDRCRGYLSEYSSLVSAIKKGTGFRNVDLEKARKGLEFSLIMLRDIRNNRVPDFFGEGFLEHVKSFFNRRFGGRIRDGIVHPMISPILYDEEGLELELFLRRITLRKQFEIAATLIPGLSGAELFSNLNDNDFEAAVRAHEEIWKHIDSVEIRNYSFKPTEKNREFFGQFLSRLEFGDNLIPMMLNFLLQRDQVEHLISQRRAGARVAHELRDPVLGLNEFTYLKPFQIILRSPDEKYIVVWVYNRRDLPEKYKQLASSGSDEDYFLATSFEGKNEVVLLSIGSLVKLAVPSALALERKVIASNSGYATAIVTLEKKNNLAVHVVNPRVIRFGFHPETQKPAEASKEISFVVEQEIFSAGETRQEPILVPDGSKTLIARQIRDYIGSLSPDNFDQKLLLDFFNRTNGIVVHVGRKYSNGRFGLFVDQNFGPFIRINIQESELDVIANGGQFEGLGTEKSERFKGINNLLNALRDLDRISRTKIGDYRAILGVTPFSSKEEIQKKYRLLAGRLHPDKGVDHSGEAFKRLKRAYDELTAKPGAFRLLEFLGIKNLALAGVLESLLDLLVATYFIPRLAVASSAGIADWGLAALDVTGSLFIILLVGKFFVHFLGGVSQPGEQPAKTLRNTNVFEMFSVALGATFTASKSLVMLPFLAVAILAPLSAWIAIPLGLIGVLLGSYLHAWSNYLTEVPYLNAISPAAGVSVYSHPVDVSGNLQTPDPRANLVGFLKRIALGGPAAPAYTQVDQAIYSVHVKGQQVSLAAHTGSLGTATLEDNPAGWIANRALAGRGQKNDTEMAETMKFLNMAVFFSKQLLAMAKQQPDGPLFVEVPSAQELQDNLKTQMALAAVLMAYGELESVINRPLTLVARGEGASSEDQPWASTDAVQSAAMAALQRYAPSTAPQFAQGVAQGRVGIVHAVGSLITTEGQGFRYNLANIINQTYGDQRYTSALVFGNEEHFDTTGVTVVVRNYFDLAARLVESMKGMVLFLTAA